MSVTNNSTSANMFDAAFTDSTLANSKPSQSFRKKPDAKLKVSEGSTILLPCEVDNQQGMAQWLKDGVPVFVNNGERFASHDFPNLVVKGNASKGEHSIELRAASSINTGLYECQVTAGDSSLDEELRAMTNITIVSLPTSDAGSTSTTMKPIQISHRSIEQPHYLKLAHNNPTASHSMVAIYLVLILVVGALINLYMKIKTIGCHKKWRLPRWPHAGLAK